MIKFGHKLHEDLSGVLHFGGFGEMYRFKFANGYGASVVQNEFSYGHQEGLYELAVLRFEENSEDWHIVYDTHITNDVIGNLNPDGVEGILKQIEALEGEGANQRLEPQLTEREKWRHEAAESLKDWDKH